MDPRRPSELKSATPKLAERLLAISSVAKAVRFTTQLYQNILGHNAYVDATLLGVKVTACTVGHLATVVVNRVIGMDNLNNWACQLLDEVLVWTSGIADTETRPPVESNGKADQVPRDRGDRVTILTRKKVKAERKLKEKIIQSGHEEIHTVTSSEHKHELVGCSKGMQQNRVTELEKEQTDVSRNQRNGEGLQHEDDIEVAAENKAGCGGARLGGSEVEVEENGREAENMADRKETVVRGAEIKGEAEKLGEKKPDTQKLTMYRNGLEREGSTDNKVLSIENDNGTEAITEKKTETREFIENEVEKESGNKNGSESVTEVMYEIEVTKNKDDALVVSENKSKAEEVAEDTNKTEDSKENKNKIKEVMQNNIQTKQVVENKTVIETKVQANGAAETKTEAEGAAETKTEAEGAAETKTEAEGAAETKTEAEGAAETKTEAEGAAETKTEAEGAAETEAEAEGAAETKTEAEGAAETEAENKLGTEIENKQGGSAEKSREAGTEKGGGAGGPEPRPGGPAAKVQSLQAANAGGSGRKNKKKNSRRKK